MPLPIERYALLGDLTTAALVGTDGSIDWLCLPRFDSGAVFAAILGGHDHGRWRLGPTDPGAKVTRRYVGSSLVLETEFTTPTGRVRLTDFMPPRDRRADVHRRVEGVEGEVEMSQEYVLRFDYGRVRPWVRRVRDNEGREAIAAIAGPDALCLRGDVLPDAVDHRHEGSFTVRRGETYDFSLTWYPSHEKLPRCHDTGERLTATLNYWHAWSERCSYTGPYRETVLRSLLTLKALTFAETGGMVAAPTTSLPELIGGPRNWDYRYCWLRDAALSLSALVETGFTDEARAWRAWLLRTVAGDPEDLQIMYGVGGERRLSEWTADWLPGYENSAPVRIGNAAHGQVQFDVYGEVMDALAAARAAGLAEDDFSWPLQATLVDSLAARWRQPDSGIWEVRGEPRAFTHSRVMSWVALDRAVRAVEEYGLPGPVDAWRAAREEIRAEVLAEGFDPAMNSFTQYYGSGTVDAALLEIGTCGFLPHGDPRTAGTVDAVIRDLKRGPLVWRYATSHATEKVDGLPPGEGAFLACSFWLVKALAESGREKEARLLFEELLELCNDVGLLAEEYEPGLARQVGNFPQAFSHLTLVHAALALERAPGG
ncbi:glucoamylase [Actinorhabdospora filicis]|uniref:Glucoamylase n=1 Tax=Actinorhabdospora filicis TaxID=1785913 RepID=A0A9W6SGE9_9ACTN|nr:glycoside hydrolase family 15 protein [Actinorhabdospora filicis]GLZ76675.1 glucoamylase [Actinorhabdospora filicis]